MRALQRMRQAIREQRYRISSHANEEMSDDNLLAEDIESIILILITHPHEEQWIAQSPK